jgi:hypothetical protein
VKNVGGQVSTASKNLIAQFGPEIPLPDLRVEIAKCDREGDREPGLWAALPHGESPVRLFEPEARRGAANAGRSMPAFEGKADITLTGRDVR